MVIETEEFTFAETKDEAFWIEIKERYEKNLAALKKDQKFIEAIIEMCESKIKKNQNSK